MPLMVVQYKYIWMGILQTGTTFIPFIPIANPVCQSHSEK